MMDEPCIFLLTTLRGSHWEHRAPDLHGGPTKPDRGITVKLQQLTANVDGSGHVLVTDCGFATINSSINLGAVEPTANRDLGQPG